MHRQIEPRTGKNSCRRPAVIIVADQLYLFHEFLVLLCALTRLAGRPRVVSASRNAQLPTHQSNREIVLLRLDNPVGLYELSLAKKDAAFFKKSRSMVT